jgi:UDP:flavonoid glycosyltransferase YjiC (YdhE family)
MRITITTAGSRGDVQPYVALGLGLEEVGHEVHLATYAPFEGFVRGHGLSYHPVSGDPDGAVAELLDAGLNSVKGAQTFRRFLGSTLEQNLAEYREACRYADAVIYSPVGFLGHHVAEKMGVPAIGAAVQPLFSRTRRFPSSLLGKPLGGFLEGGLLGGLYNRLTYPAAEQLFWQTMRPMVTEARAELGLAPLPFLGPFRNADQPRLPILYGWSPSVLPQPTEWREQLCTTGYWFLDRPGWWPPEELVDFLEAGPPPVSIGFGSMNNVDPEEITTRLLEALRPEGNLTHRMGRHRQRGPAGRGLQGERCSPRLALRPGTAGGAPRRCRHHGGLAAGRPTNRRSPVFPGSGVLGLAGSEAGRGARARAAQEADLQPALRGDTAGRDRRGHGEAGASSGREDTGRGRCSARSRTSTTTSRACKNWRSEGRSGRV